MSTKVYQWKKAKAVWPEKLKSQYNQFVGFYTEADVPESQTITVYLAARSYYRLYINGEMRTSGPARTAHGYCRIEEIQIDLAEIPYKQNKIHLAVEVVAIDKPGKYSNDATLEPGMLIAEIVDESGKVLVYTGSNDFKSRELEYRRSLVETMSHSRGIVEWYDLDKHSFDWMVGKESNWQKHMPIDTEPSYLIRRSPQSDYNRIPMDTMENIGDMVACDSDGGGYVLNISRFINEEYYKIIPEENKFLESLRQEKEAVYTGKYVLGRSQGRKQIEIIPGENAVSLTFGREKPELGFIEFFAEVNEDCCIDIINTDHRHLFGELKGNTYVARYNLKAGSYHLITFEPKFTRYVRMILRTTGKAVISYPAIINFSYPDAQDCYFTCSDGDLNRIYEGSRRTLRMNTMDIFMDCPQRERGGWLCDSEFSSRGAWQMFGDLSVEQDFIENFMLTDGNVKWHGFFPEVYPGSKADPADVGIPNWSYWLIVQLHNYYKRSGDRKFIDKCRDRVVCFVNGFLSLRGESGLIEQMNNQFVDWSLSNQAFSLQPISVPNNCLAVRVLEEMSELYSMPEWRAAAADMRQIIETVDVDIMSGGIMGDSASYENGRLVRGSCQTEAGAALELWSGFHQDDADYINNFVYTMGYKPMFRSNPNVGKANIFIGMIIRFDVLQKMDQIEILVDELRDIYLAELRDGSGTFFENYNAMSGCHGANALVGTLLTNKVLGLGEPEGLTKTVEINPHPGTLRWANGSAKCADGMIYMSWSADQVEHVLRIQLQMPEGWRGNLRLPFELSGWKVYLNDCQKQ